MQRHRESSRGRKVPEAGKQQTPEDAALEELLKGVGVSDRLIFAASSNQIQVDVFLTSMHQDSALKILVLPFTQDECRSFVEANFAEFSAHLVPPAAPVAVIAAPPDPNADPNPDPPLPQLVEEIAGLVPLQIYSLCLMLRTKREEKKAALAEKDVVECVREFGTIISADIIGKLEDAFKLEVRLPQKVEIMSLAVSCSHSFKNQPKMAQFVDWRFYYPYGEKMVAKPVSALAHQATVAFTVEGAGTLQLQDRIRKLQDLSSAFDINPSVTGFVLEGIVNGCLKFCEWSEAKFNVFVKTGKQETASPLPGWPSRPKNIQYFEKNFQFEGSQPTLAPFFMAPPSGRFRDSVPAFRMLLRCGHPSHP